MIDFIIATMPELLAQTNMDAQSTARLREELSKFCIWLSKHSETYFKPGYITVPNEYIEKAKGVPNAAPATATSRPT